MTTHSSILAWRTAWTNESGGLQRMELQRVGQDWSTNLHTHTHTHTHTHKTIEKFKNVPKSIEVEMVQLNFKYKLSYSISYTQHRNSDSFNEEEM